MAKKKTPKRKKREKVHRIDHIPKYSQKPRSPRTSQTSHRLLPLLLLFFYFSLQCSSPSRFDAGVLQSVKIYYQKSNQTPDMHVTEPWSERNIGNQELWYGLKQLTNYGGLLKSWEKDQL
ncbi:hypothetical protein F0562_016895 [Nyssa sinensis]|uniref:Uncharacterized protein n=1 Tax=Nyssa sinensis TaxID=561372 RepID=A0A5J4ZF25_9ASTE|nr:hypothetical protein F0562_016895 [Nyssa sinensis]